MTIGRFVSSDLPDRVRDDRSLHSMTIGQRFDRIEVVCTVGEYLEPRLHEWIRSSLLCRLVGGGALAIEVRP